jgi:hypothetical protein
MRQPPWMQALHQQIADAGPALIIASSTHACGSGCVQSNRPSS